MTSDSNDDQETDADSFMASFKKGSNSGDCLDQVIVPNKSSSRKIQQPDPLFHHGEAIPIEHASRFFSKWHMNRDVV